MKKEEIKKCHINKNPKIKVKRTLIKWLIVKWFFKMLVIIKNVCSYQFKEHGFWMMLF